MIKVIITPKETIKTTNINNKTNTKNNIWKKIIIKAMI